MTRAITLTLLFWVIGALLVAAVPIAFMKIAAIVAVAFGYVKISRHLGSLDQALIVGALWLLLDICTEIAVTSRAGHAWFGLIGSPDAPVLRTFLLAAWITAPAIFVRRSLVLPQRFGDETEADPWFGDDVSRT